MEATLNVTPHVSLPQLAAPITFDQIKRLLPGAVDAEDVGSRVTVDPPPTDTDADVLVLVEDIGAAWDHVQTGTNRARYAEWARKHDPSDYKPEDDLFEGWQMDGSYVTPMDENGDAEDAFMSISHPATGVNLIVTDSRAFYDRFLLATHVCRRLNVQPKDERIIVFQAILYGNAT